MEKDRDFIVFQAMFRTCSTYFWNKFRQLPDFVAYHEPLHERLINVHESALDAQHTKALANKLRHPETETFYFAELMTLSEPWGTVKNFSKNFPYNRACLIDYGIRLDSYATEPELYKYLSYLRTAYPDKRVMMKFCRMHMRTGWLMRQFNPVLIYLVRNPRDQFMSYWSFNGLESYFIQATILMVSKNKEHPIFRDLAKLYDIPYINFPKYQDELKRAGEIIRERGFECALDCFMFIWAFSLWHNGQHADMIIDVDMLDDSAPYEWHISNELKRLTGVTLELGDFMIPEWDKTKSNAVGTRLVTPPAKEIMTNVASAMGMSSGLVDYTISQAKWGGA